VAPSIVGARLLKPRIILRARLDSYSGYGQFACQLVHHFNRFGHDVNVWPLAVDNYYLEVHPDISKHFVHRQQAEDWEAVVSPPFVPPSKNKFTAYFTMFETTRLSAVSLGNLKRAEIVIVPNQLNAACFSAQGVDAPIHVCPLGIDPNVFRYVPMGDGPCVFGTAGNSVNSGRSRKGLDDVIDAFQVAFPDEQDVRLMVKALPGKNAVTNSTDSRIHCDVRFMDDIAMAKWYADLTCFVSASRGEGWGLMQHQAMATGRPVIAAPWAGLTEFLNGGNSYELDYKLVPAQGRFEGLGFWAEPDMWQMVEYMRQVYENRSLAADKGIAACQMALRFTWDKSMRKLGAICKEIGLLQ
jgi:glycosyltransferase involved in cell wall biosynthesis